MSSVIISCGSLIDYVNAAQILAGTSYDVITIDRKYHNEPSEMKDALIRTIEELPEEVDTVLVAMGFCGGAWSEVSAGRRIVIPRVDDCISLLLHTDDEYHPNLKQPGHLYMVEKDPADFSVAKMFVGLSEEYYGLGREELFRMMFGSYRNLDIVDTGLSDCYSEEYVLEVQKSADILDAVVDYVPGSNMLIEKLITGQWDEQFVVAHKGDMIRHGNFF